MMQVTRCPYAARVHDHAQDCRDFGDMARMFSIGNQWRGGAYGLAASPMHLRFRV